VRLGRAGRVAGTAVLAALLFLLLGACGGEGGGSGDGGELEFPRANLLVISIDTLRADRLGCYGYDRPTTPNLDALAEEAVLFEDCYANSCKTASSHMTLFTSMEPSAHKVSNFSARLGLELTQLPNNRLTLAQVLNRDGYWNAAVAGGGNLMPEMGFGRGFQRRFESGLADVHDLADRLLQRADEMAASGAPGFLFFHTYQVHGPYLPPRRFLEQFAPDPDPLLGPRVEAYVDLPFHLQWRAMNRGLGGDVPPYWEGKEEFGPEQARYLSDLYDGEIAYTDEQLGRLFEALEQKGLYDDMMIVFLADHGEEFYEHGEFEHDQLHREHMHVPLIVRLPGGRLGGTRVEGITSLVDVMPTVLQLLGQEGPPTMTGTSQVPAMLSGRTENRPVLSERVMFPDDYEATLRSDASAVIFHANNGDPGIPAELEAFDLRADPGELTNVYPDASFARRAAQALKDALTVVFNQRQVLDEVDSGKTISLDDENVAEQLESLGYTSDGHALEAPAGTPLDAWPEEN
jgi:arylsulfatase A-like enzyme